MPPALAGGSTTVSPGKPINEIRHIFFLVSIPVELWAEICKRVSKVYVEKEIRNGFDLPLTWPYCSHRSYTCVE